MKTYHFDIGNSTTGPIGLCASIRAFSEWAAVRRLRELLNERLTETGTVDLDVPDSKSGEYISIYITPENITNKNIDETIDE